MQNVVLVGMMGSGKTTIGKLVAKELGYRFLDTDEMIQESQGCTIEDIFFYAGESFFRKLETDLIKGMTNEKNVVLSTGGGIVTVEGNMDLLKAIGRVFYLDVNPELVFSRISGSLKRPLLKDPENKRENFMKIFNERKGLYMQADVVVSNNSNIKEKMVAKIMENLIDNQA